MDNQDSDTNPANLVPVAPSSPLAPDHNPALVFLGRLAPGSRRAIGQALEMVAGMLTGGRQRAQDVAWEQVRYQHVATLRQTLSERYKPATTNRVLSAVRGVLKEAWRLGLMSAEDQQRAADVANVKATTLPSGRSLGPGEIRALFQACFDHKSPLGARDAALLALLYGAGLRRSEAVELGIEHYDATTGALTVRSGKGRKDRLCYLPAGARACVATWLSARGDAPGPLLCPVEKGGKVVLRRLTPQAVLYIARNRAVEAGIKTFSPHDLRRSFVSDLLDAGADIATVQRLAGHASVSTTGRYDRRGEQTKQRAVELLHIPYTDKPTDGSASSR